jgi:hypothetical protein
LHLPDCAYTRLATRTGISWLSCPARPGPDGSVGPTASERGRRERSSSVGEYSMTDASPHTQPRAPHDTGVRDNDAAFTKRRRRSRAAGRVELGLATANWLPERPRWRSLRSVRVLSGVRHSPTPTRRPPIRHPLGESTVAAEPGRTWSRSGLAGYPGLALVFAVITLRGVLLALRVRPVGYPWSQLLDSASGRLTDPELCHTPPHCHF